MTAYPPDYTSGWNCTTHDSLTPYITQSIDISTSAYYVLTALFDSNSNNYGIISIYSTFDPAFPCANNLAGTYSSSYGEAPNIYVPVWLSVGSYVVVITTTYPEMGGIFAFHLDPVSWSGATTAISNFWNYIDSSVPNVCSTTAGTAAYTTYTWVQEVSFRLLFLILIHPRLLVPLT